MRGKKPIPVVEITHRYDFVWSLHPKFLLLVFVSIIGTRSFADARYSWNPVVHVNEDTFFTTFCQKQFTWTQKRTHRKRCILSLL